MQGTVTGPGGSEAFSAIRKGLAPPPQGAAPASSEELIDAMRELNG